MSVCAEREIRERISASLEQDGIQTLHELADLASMLDACQEQVPDIAVLGTARPNRATLDGMRALLESNPAVNVVMVCGRSGDGDIRRALGAGAAAVVLFDQIRTALGAVLRVVHAGQVSVPASCRGEVREPTLTAREKQILGLVVMGMTNGQIAGKLFLAESTVKSHLSSAFAKLEVSSRNEAVSLILDPKRGSGLGILTIPSEPLTARSASSRQNSSS